MASRANGVHVGFQRLTPKICPAFTRSCHLQGIDRPKPVTGRHVDTVGAGPYNPGVLQRPLTAIWTLVVAIAVALALPVSQLRVVAVEHACCCPDPERCKCPDHGPDTSTTTTMRPCHGTTTVHVTSQPPAFMPPVLAVVATPVLVASVPTHALATPRAEPPPPRPDAPS